jgi:hypothetical protein
LNRAARPALKLAAALALAALLPGCAVFMMPPQAAALQRHAPADLPRRGELTATPFFAQTPYHCGPAALATALGAVGLKADPQALGDAVFLPAREGSLQLEMVAGARRQGAVATRLPPLLTALVQQVAAGQVAVVLLNLGLDFAPRWHYAVLVGYDLDAAEVVLRSGVTERELPVRLALVDEGLHAFQRRLVHHVAGHGLAGVGVGGVDAHFQLPVEQLLAQGDGHARLGHDAADQRFDGSRPGRPRHHAVDQALLASASSALMKSPVTSISKASLRGRLRLSATLGVLQNRPRLTPLTAKRASRAATARSHMATSWQPAAVAMPCTRAITGTRQVLDGHHHAAALLEQRW